MLALAASADGGTDGPPLTTYTDEQIEGCGPNFEQVKKTEAKPFSSAEEKAVAVDNARKYLRMCLDLVAAQPFDSAARAARAKCPCRLADLEWTDSESKDCREPIERYYRYGWGGGQAYVAGFIDDIRSCLLRAKANRVRLARQEEEQTASEHAAEEARIREAEESRARSDRDEAHRRTPAFMQSVWSVQICIGEQNRSTALATLEQEKKYSRITGSANLSRREELKHDLQHADDLIAASKSQLKTARLRSSACLTLRRLIDCVGVESEDCRAEKIQDALRLLQLPDDDE